MGKRTFKSLLSRNGGGCMYRIDKKKTKKKQLIPTESEKKNQRLENEHLM